MAGVQEALDRLWSDEGLKARLFTDPKPVLKEFGLEIPEDVSVQVHENTNKVFNAVLPMKPETKTSLGSDPLSQIIERAWSDPAFKEKLLNDPKEAAAEMGAKLPENIDVKVWENTATQEHLVLPANPIETELSEMELEAVAGGTLSKGTQVGAGCGMAGAVAGGMGTASLVMTALAFTAVGAAVAAGLGIGGAAAGVAAGVGSAAGGMAASNGGKC